MLSLFEIEISFSYLQSYKLHQLKLLKPFQQFEIIN